MKKAIPFKRLIALLLDFLTPFILLALTPYVFGNFFRSFFNSIIYIGFIISQLYFFTKGQTIGKKLTKIKVVNKENEESISFLGMLIRETLGKAISGSIFSLGFLWILIDNDNQGWHDKLVNSIVVSENNKEHILS